MGQAGVEFSTLSRRSERLLKEWIFIQLLASAQHSAGDAALLYGKSSQEAAELLFSSRARPAIRLKPRALRAAKRSRQTAPCLLHLPWFPFANFSARAFAAGGWADPALGRVAFCIDLHGHGRCCPGVAAGTGDGNRSGRGVRVLYRFLFLFWMGGTPGDWIAGLTEACDRK